MSDLRLIFLSLLTILVTPTAGCVEAPGKEIAVLSNTQESVEIWGRNQVPGAIGPQLSWATDQEIADLAQWHCHEHGRSAQKVSEHRAGGARNVLFRCIAGYEVSPIPQ